jgi:hypothetical protein
MTAPVVGAAAEFSYVCRLCAKVGQKRSTAPTEEAAVVTILELRARPHEVVRNRQLPDVHRSIHTAMHHLWGAAR